MILFAQKGPIILTWNNCLLSVSIRISLIVLIFDPALIESALLFVIGSFSISWETILSNIEASFNFIPHWEQNLDSSEILGVLQFGHAGRDSENWLSVLLSTIPFSWCRG